MAIPSEIDGRTVTSLGSMFMMGTMISGSSTLKVPPTVTRIQEDAFYGASGIKSIVLDMDFETFNSFRLIIDYDCRVTVKETEGPRNLDFFKGYPMFFPDFDEEVHKRALRLSEDMAISRLSTPLGLTAENREAYTRYLKERMNVLAERSVSSNDREKMTILSGLNLISEEEYTELIKKSVLSGKTAMTSTLLSLKWKLSKSRRGRGNPSP
jgi:hypothetical protein